MEVNNLEAKLQNKWFYSFCAVILLVLIFWACSSPAVSSATDKEAYFLLHAGWTQQVDGAEIPLDDIQDFHPVEEGAPLSFTCTLPEDTLGKIFLFYSRHQEVRCYVEDTLIHSFTIPQGFSILKTPGSAWNQVDFTPAMAGKSCRLEFYNPIAFYNNRLYDIHFIDNVDANSVRVQLLCFHAMTAAGILILTVFSFVNGIIWRNQRRRWYFFSLGQMYLYMLLWLLAELNFFDIFFGRPILSHLLSSAFVRIIPIGVWCLFISGVHQYRRPLLINALRILLMINLILPWVLQFTMGISLLETMSLHYVTMFLLSVVLLVFIMEKLLHFRSIQREEIPYLLIILPLIGGTIDISILFFNPDGLVQKGLGLFIGCLLYTASTYLFFARQDRNTIREKTEIERSYRHLQTFSLMQQIKAHFIFNTLNAISALCKQDPWEADRAIKLFATYLRSYMYLVNQHSTIPFQDELDLVRSYLTIEQIRFEAQLSFTLDIQFNDFQIPPLSVLPLVENAVNHGIRGQLEAGSVTISSYKSGNYVQIIVSDDGTGFDPDSLPSQSDLGLNHVKDRIATMCSGTLDLDSKVGEGTRAVLTIPLTPEHK